MYYFEFKPEKRTVPVMNGTEIKVDASGEPIMEEIDPAYEGVVKVKAAESLDRMKYMRETQMLDSGDGVEALDPILRTEKLYEIGKKHIEKVDLVRKEDGYPIQNLEDLCYDKDGLTIIAAVANKVIGGATLGKELKRS